jgi:hypothetical protein
LLNLMPVGFEERPEFFHRRQLGQVAGDEEFLIHPGGGKLDLGAVFVAAQQNPHGWRVARCHHVRFEPVHVKIHLSRIRRAECAHLQVEQHMATQQAVIEDEVHAMMFTSLRHAELPRLETKPAAQLQEETLEMV